MTDRQANPEVDALLAKEKKWSAEFARLRAIVLDCALDETVKWGQPCYTAEGRNIVLIHGFKEYCALLFFKGALMQDPANLLIQQTENVQAGRQIRFIGLAEIVARENALKSYIHDAIAVEKSGATIAYKKPTEFAMAEEFQQKLDADPALKAAFAALTPGRQRAYLLYFSAAKQAKTRAARVEKCIPSILDGKGLDD